MQLFGNILSSLIGGIVWLYFDFNPVFYKVNDYFKFEQITKKSLLLSVISSFNATLRIFLNRYKYSCVVKYCSRFKATFKQVRAKRTFVSVAACFTTFFNPYHFERRQVTSSDFCCWQHKGTLDNMQQYFQDTWNTDRKYVTRRCFDEDAASRWHSRGRWTADDKTCHRIRICEKIRRWVPAEIGETERKLIVRPGCWSFLPQSVPQTLTHVSCLSPSLRQNRNATRFSDVYARIYFRVPLDRRLRPADGCLLV